MFDEILAENKPAEVPQNERPQSILDINSFFRVKLNGIENLKLSYVHFQKYPLTVSRSYEEFKDTSQVYVMLELYHGDQLIAGTSTIQANLILFLKTPFFPQNCFDLPVLGILHGWCVTSKFRICLVPLDSPLLFS
jgi:hypothetical protein